MVAQPSPLDRALVALDKLRRRVAELESAAREPIAIVGAGCRLPGGVESPEALWEALEGGLDAITEVPPDRWTADELAGLDPSQPGERGRRYAALVHGLDRFDAAAFSVSPREAARLDPQQRLVLEVACEALVDAAMAPASLAGQRVGVFVGAYNADLRDLGLQDPGAIDAHAVTGGANSVISGRLSYALDLRGPSLTIDTACSSALVAVHLACGALRQGECALAVAGGVNVLLSPLATLLASKAFALSPEGRVRAFDAQASGFVRGEGCGLVVLKRLSDALRDGDPIHAVIRGSAVNQDGHSAGLTAPNGAAQEAVIRAALDAAGVAPAQIGCVEAFGSGSPIGDPIELEALRAVYGAQRPDGGRVLVASVKTNLGHLEAASGAAGLLKAIGCVVRGRVPPHLHLRTLTPRVALEGTALSIPTVTTPWPDAPAAPRRAAVSAFGMSGTNAHLVLEQAPPRARPERGDRGPLMVSLSARTGAGLEAQAQRYARALLARPGDAAAIADTTLARGERHPHRRVVVGTDAAALVEALSRPRRAVLAGAPVVFVASAGERPWGDAARALARSGRAFGPALERARPLVGAAVVDAVLDGQGAPTPLMQLAFAHALAAELAMLGIAADRAAGVGAGEIIAAHAAGVLELAAAVRALSEPDAPIVLSDAARLWSYGAPSAWRARAAHGDAELSRLLSASVAEGRAHVVVVTGARLTDAWPRRGDAVLVPPCEGDAAWRTLMVGVAALAEVVGAIDLSALAAPGHAEHLPPPAWDHQRFPIARAPSPRRHPLWGRVTSAHERLHIAEATLGATRPAYLGERRVSGRAVLGEAAAVELALWMGEARASEESRELADVEFGEPLVLPDDDGVQVRASVEWSGPDRAVFEVSAEGARSPWARGVLRARGAAAPAPVDLVAARAERSLAGTGAGAASPSEGALELGPSARVVGACVRTAQGAVAELGWPLRAREDGEHYAVHPVMLGAALDVAAAVSPGPAGRLRRIGAVALHARPVPGRPLVAVVSVVDGVAAVALCAEDGRVCVRLEGLTYASAEAAADAAESTTVALSPRWTAAPRAAAGATPGSTLAVHLEGPLGERLRAALGDRGARVVEPGRDADGVVMVVGDAEALLSTYAQRARPPRVWVVALSAEDADRAAALEAAHPHLAVTTLEAGGGEDEAIAEALAAELCAAGAERAVRVGRAREVLRWGRADARSRSREPLAHRAYVLAVDTPGTLEALALEPLARRSVLRAGEVEVEVQAAGLNFLDVLTALGARPDRPAGPAVLGSECAGVITRVGPGVRGLAVGDAVIAVASGCVGSHVVALAALTVPKPRALDFAQAAALPIAYLTAWFALVELARVEPGERVLVHAATGGVGLAALAVARLRGADVLATAGSEAKRAYLRAQGVAAPMSSRALSFAEEARAQTGGRGVDVVLNALTGPAVERGLAALASGGRFVEIAKKDIYADAPIGLAPFRNNLSYHALDLARLLVERPERVGRALAAIVGEVEAGRLPPLPVERFEVDHALEAFRHMAEAKHIGKIVLELAGRAPEVTRRPRPLVLTSADVVLLSGARGALEAPWAQRLLAWGAGRVLVSEAPPGSDARIERVALPTDDEAALDAWARARAAQGAPITAVLHVAEAADAEVDRAAAVRMARALDRVLGDVQPFALVYDAAAFFEAEAHPTAAAEAAALVALAASRRRRGLLGTCVGAGPWAGGARAGLRPLGADAVLDVIGPWLSDGGPAHVLVADLDVRQWLEAHPRAAADPRWSILARDPPARRARGSFVEALRQASPSAREALMIDHVREHLARVLRLTPAEVAAEASFGALGLDSLTGLEVRNRLENTLGLRLPATLLWTQPTAGALAGRLLAELSSVLGGGAEAPAVSPLSPAPAASAARVEPAEVPASRDVGAELASLDEGELARQLAEELAALRGR